MTDSYWHVPRRIWEYPINSDGYNISIKEPTMTTEQVLYEQPEGEVITLSPGGSITTTALSSKAQLHSYKIMGAFYRARAGTPAVAILKVLPVETPLLLRPEPTNDNHSKAIAVYLQMSNFPELNESQLCIFRADLASSGFELGDVQNVTEHHLGYIPREVADQMELAGELPAELVFDLDGTAKVRFSL